MLTNWIYADVLEAIALEQPDAPAISQGATRRSWKALIDRSRSLGAAFLDAGLGHQSKIALYTYNASEYLEGVVAALGVGMVPINTNYRYQSTELLYLWENADAEAVIFHGSFSQQVAELPSKLPLVNLWIHVSDGTGTCPHFSVGF